jgi:hypothetical protein
VPFILLDGEFSCCTGGKNVEAIAVVGGFEFEFVSDLLLVLLLFNDLDVGIYDGCNRG